MLVLTASCLEVGQNPGPLLPCLSDYEQCNSNCQPTCNLKITLLDLMTCSIITSRHELSAKCILRHEVALMQAILQQVRINLCSSLSIKGLVYTLSGNMMLVCWAVLLEQKELSGHACRQCMQACTGQSYIWPVAADRFQVDSTLLHVCVHL